jgi:16S rRNA (cytidine1402-2'-O)-methyltransferase
MYGFKAQLVTYNDHNHSSLAEKLVAEIAGRKVAYALVSDAGTPLISDPGYKLVLEAIGADIPVIAVPGPSAVISALSVAGLPTDRFLFEGFLPRKQTARVARLSELVGLPYTVVIFEAPQRIRVLVETIVKELGSSRKMVLAREMTKLHEQIFRGTASEINLLFDTNIIAEKGEFVVLIGPDDSPKRSGEIERVLNVVLPLTDRKTALKITQELTGESRNTIYEHIVGKIGRI